MSVLAAIATSETPAGAIVMVMAWGIAFGAWPVCLQIWMFTSSPALFEAGSALLVSSFQISLSAGAAIGGVLVDSAGVGSAFITSGVLAGVGAFLAMALRITPRRSPDNRLSE